jgi:hypothetical protein
MQRILDLFRLGIIFSGLILSFAVRGSTYYVAVGGSDTGDGTLAAPYATISKAISQIAPGDTIYVLKGMYLLSATVQISSSNSGTVSDTCRLWAFPGDTVILDFYRQAFGNRGISVRGDYWHIRGLIVKNAGDNGMYIEGGHNTIEDCVFSGNDDSGLQISGGGAYNTVINCDAFYNADPDNEDADGFAAKLDIGPGNEFHGCRSWNNSDDGWDLFEADDLVVIDNCWAFYNGYLPQGNPSAGDGNGFKLGGNYLIGNHLVKNCISFNNRKYGYHQNNNTGSVTIYNSLGWDNDKQNFNFYLTEADTSVLVNNISFAGGSNDKFTNCILTTNSWQTGGADAGDFISLDKNLAKDARQPDGSLPSNNLARLLPGSGLIDAGTDVGLYYTGTSPDLGPFELISTDAEYTLHIQTEGLGGVWLSPPGGLYEAGQEVMLTVWSGEGYEFQGWSGDTSGTGDTIVILMDSDKSILANFTESDHVNHDSLRIEAENMIYSSYVFERLSGASNGKIICASSATSFDQAEITFNGDSDYYRTNVRYFDQVDGMSTYRFFVNGILLSEWQGDSATGSNNIFVGHTIVNVALKEGDVISLESDREGPEYGRIDCIDLVKSEYIPENILNRFSVQNQTLFQNFPNPASQTTNIRFYLADAAMISLKLSDIQGRTFMLIDTEWYAAGMHDYLLNVSGLSSGIYCYSLIDGDWVYTRYLQVK